MHCNWAEEHISVDQYGRFRPCCNWRYIGNEKVLNFQDNTVDEYINSEFKKNLIDTLEKDIWPEGCWSCQRAEEGGTQSIRQERINKPFKDMEIKFGNLCNLGCYMCTSDKSSVLYKTYSDMIENGLGDERIEEEVNYHESKTTMYVEDSPWYDNPKKLQELAEFASTRKRIRFTGGEPTVNTYLRNFLKTLSSINTNVDLRITTNGMTLTDSLVELLSKFSHVEMTFSLDAVGKYNEYLRWPSNWNKIESNFKKAKEHKNIRFDINTVVSVLNVHLLDDIIEWGSINNVDEHTFLPAHEPDILQPKLAHDWQKEIFAKTYEKWNKPHGRPRIRLDKCKNFVFMERDEELLQGSFDFLDRLDKQRNTNWRETFGL
jgi:MoaA/NifB/PqqE/SkfB family radical SAM enzyme